MWWLVTLRSLDICKQGLQNHWDQESFTAAVWLKEQQRRMAFLWSRGATSLMLRLRRLSLQPLRQVESTLMLESLGLCMPLWAVLPPE